MSGTHPWAPEDQGILLAAIEPGWSASETANAVGKTKNACIDWANRRGLKFACDHMKENQMAGKRRAVEARAL